MEILFFLIAAVVCSRVTVIEGAEGCSTKTISNALKRPCPAGQRDDGTSCWLDSYGRGTGRVSDKTKCPSGTRDDGTSCWLDSYGRGVGRVPDKSPCPSGLRDDGTSCWNDAHIYGKGCCCTLWGCCGKCKSGYHDDGCTCRKTGVGIKVYLSQRQSCRSNEERYGALCYPKCKSGYHPVGCCVCHPEGGPRVVKTLAQRQHCRDNEDLYGALCYPKCKTGFRPVGCCICHPNGGPGIKVTVFKRYYCPEPTVLFNSVCLDLQCKPPPDVLVGDVESSLGRKLSATERESLKSLITK